MMDSFGIKTDGTPLSYKLWTFRFGYLHGREGNFHFVCYEEFERATTRHKFKMVRGWSTYSHAIPEYTGKRIKRPSIPDFVLQRAKYQLVEEFKKTIQPNPEDFREADELLKKEGQ